MTQLLVRDVPEHLAEALKQRAHKNGRSVQAEHRAILEAALLPNARDFAERARQLREETRGRIFTPSEELIRMDRDR